MELSSCSGVGEVKLALDPNNLWSLSPRLTISELAGAETHHPQTQTMQLASRVVDMPTETHWHVVGLAVLHENESMSLKAKLVGATYVVGLGNHGLGSPSRTL